MMPIDLADMLAQLTGEPKEFWEKKMADHDEFLQRMDENAAEYESRTGKPFIEYKDDA